MGRKATVHSQRKGKNGVFKAKHNDCTYLPEDERPSENIYWSYSCGFTDDPSFEKDEINFYKKHFQKALDIQNEKHKKARNYKRIKSIEDWHENVKMCPDETLYYLGSKDNEFISKDVYKKIILEQLAWEQKTFPNVRILDVGFHFHEDGAPHVHQRKVFIAHDEQGNEIIHQDKALQEMGIEKTSHYSEDDKRSQGRRYANRKITYTDMCRSHLIELCNKYGIEIDTIPRDPSESGRDREDFIIHKAHTKAEGIVSAANDQAVRVVNNANEEADRIVTDAKIRAEEDIQKAKKKAKEEAKAEAELEIASERENLALERISVKKDRELLERDKKALQSEKKAFDDLAVRNLENYVKLKRPDVVQEYVQFRKDYQNKRANTELDYREQPEKVYEKTR